MKTFNNFKHQCFYDATRQGVSSVRNIPRLSLRLEILNILIVVI